MSDAKEDRVTVYESTLRELLKVDTDGMSQKQLHDHIGEFKAAWERFLTAAAVARISREDIDHDE